MQRVTPAQIQPVVRIANYHDVAPLHCWPQRTIPDLQLIFIVKGHFEYNQGDQSVSAGRGDVLWIEPGQVHTLCHMDSHSTGTISGIHLELIPTGSWTAGDYRLSQAPERVTQANDSAYLGERFRRMAQVFGNYLPQRDLLLSTMAREVVLLLLGHWQQPATANLSPRMAEMLHFIRANLQGSLSRQQLALAFGVSPEHINLLFRRELGTTPSAVINRERVMLAYRLIHEQGKSVKEAAYAAGYQDPFYFSRVFKRILGIPPSQVN